MSSFRPLAAALLMAGLLQAAATAQAAGRLVLTPESSTVQAGDTVELAVTGTGFVDNIIGGGFSLAFDAGLLQLDSSTIATATWEFVPNGGAIDNGAGTLSHASFNTFRSPAPTGDFSVGTLRFIAGPAGGVANVQLLPSLDFSFNDELANSVAVEFGSAQITVSVPEPGTWLMALAGLAALGLRQSRLARQP